MDIDWKSELKTYVLLYCLGDNKCEQVSGKTTDINLNEIKALNNFPHSNNPLFFGF